MQAVALQFVRKVGGFKQPSKANGAAFHTAGKAVVEASRDLLRSLETNAPPRDRVEEYTGDTKRKGDFLRPVSFEEGA